MGWRGGLQEINWQTDSVVAKCPFPRAIIKGPPRTRCSLDGSCPPAWPQIMRQLVSSPLFFFLFFNISPCLFTDKLARITSHLAIAQATEEPGVERVGTKNAKDAHTSITTVVFECQSYLMESRLFNRVTISLLTGT